MHIEPYCRPSAVWSVIIDNDILVAFSSPLFLCAGASDTADALFQEVLGRKDRADSTRNALNVLQRFKFLFNLPLNIERNILRVCGCIHSH